MQLDRYQDLAWELLVELHEAAGDSSAAALARREHAQVQAELDVALPEPRRRSPHESIRHPGPSRTP